MWIEILVAAAVSGLFASLLAALLVEGFSAQREHRNEMLRRLEEACVLADSVGEWGMDLTAAVLESGAEMSDWQVVRREIMGEDIRNRVFRELTKCRTILQFYFPHLADQMNDVTETLRTVTESASGIALQPRIEDAISRVRQDLQNHSNALRDDATALTAVLVAEAHNVQQPGIPSRFISSIERAWEFVKGHWKRGVSGEDSH